MEEKDQKIDQKTNQKIQKMPYTHSVIDCYYQDSKAPPWLGAGGI